MGKKQSPYLAFKLQILTLLIFFPIDSEFVFIKIQIRIQIRIRTTSLKSSQDFKKTSIFYITK